MSEKREDGVKRCTFLVGARSRIEGEYRQFVSASDYDALAAELAATQAKLAEAERRAEYWKAEHLAGNVRISELEARGAEAVDILGDVRMYHGTREQLAVYDNEDWIARRDAFLSRTTAQQPPSVQEPPCE